MGPIDQPGKGQFAGLTPQASPPAVYSVTVYGRYGENHVAGDGHGDRLNAVFTGDDGNTFFDVTGGVSGGNLTDGYSGTLTNSYGGFVEFSGISRFNISTGIFNDNITTGAGDDTISSGDGNDTLNSGSGRDVVFGGAGASDRWVADTSFSGQAIVIDITAGAAQSYLGSGLVSGIEFPVPDHRSRRRRADRLRLGQRQRRQYGQGRRPGYAWTSTAATATTR